MGPSGDVFLGFQRREQRKREEVTFGRRIASNPDSLPELWRGLGWRREDGPALWAAALRAGTCGGRACWVGGRVAAARVCGCGLCPGAADMGCLPPSVEVPSYKDLREDEAPALLRR